MDSIFTDLVHHLGAGRNKDLKNVPAAMATARFLRPGVAVKIAALDHAAARHAPPASAGPQILR